MFQFLELQDYWISFAILHFSLNSHILINFLIWYNFQVLLLKQMEFWLSVCNENIYSCLVGCWDLCGLAEETSLNTFYQIWPVSTENSCMNPSWLGFQTYFLTTPCAVLWHFKKESQKDVSFLMQIFFWRVEQYLWIKYKCQLNKKW